MKKKLFCILMCCIMMVSVSPIISAQETETVPTIDEILSEYSNKVLESQSSVELTPSSNSRQFTSNTLEQETVNTLVAAGYEAYNITATNYDELENQLQMNFDSYGLTRTGSYIMVISGEDNVDSNTSSHSRAVDPPEYDYVDTPGGSFVYYYEPYDRNYTMRYVTLVYTARSATTNVTSTFGSTYTCTLANTAVTGSIDSNSIYTTGKTLGTYRTLWGLSSSATYSVPTLSVTCSVVWTRKFIEVYDDSVSSWMRTTFSEYASISATFSGKYYNNRNYAYDTVSYSTNATIYSPNYNNSAVLKEMAVLFFTGFQPTEDRTWEIQVKATDTSGTSTVLVTVWEDF